ncbi:MAG: phosphotransferase [Reyranellaceae bacterium]
MSDFASLLRELHRVPALASLREGDLAPLSSKGTAHGHVAIAPEIDGRRLVARIAYAFPNDPTAAARLDVQAEAFRRCAPSGVTPRLFAVAPPSAALPGGLLIVDRIDGRVPRLPAELDLMARSLAAIHSLPVPPRDKAAPVPFPDDAILALLRTVETNAPFFDRMAIADAGRSALREELAFARDYANSATRGQPDPVLALADTHPGNFLVDAQGKAWFVDLEKVHYGAAAIDLAHATLETSTRWDREVNLTLPRDAIVSFHRRYLDLIGVERTARLRPFLLPLRRMTWLRTMAFMARWSVQTDPAYRGDEPDRWSDLGLSPEMRAHARAAIADLYRPQTVERIRAEWLGGESLAP